MSEKSKPQAAAAPNHPLRQLREILGWSREEFSKKIGMSQATVQNIERGAAPLPEEWAFAIEAATSCNAMALIESSNLWRKLQNEEKAFFETALQFPPAMVELESRLLPMRLDREPFTAQDYANYQGSRLAPESVDGALQDLGLRLDLLLRPLAAKPDRFRWMYRYLVQVLNKAKNERGPGDEAMTSYAMSRGKAKLDTKTIGELMKIRDIAESPQWKASRAAERFSPKEKAHVVHEQYPFWPSQEVLEDAETYLAPDHVFGERIVWRITLPDGKPLAIVIDNTHATGLQVRFTRSMIDVKREEREARGQKAE